MSDHFNNRLNKARILVIGASYADFDQDGNYPYDQQEGKFLTNQPKFDGWSQNDPSYIGFAKVYGEEQTPFVGGNPFAGLDWNMDINDLVSILNEILGEKKFDEIWIDRGTIHHIENNNLAPLLNYLFLNNLTQGGKFHMPSNITESFGKLPSRMNPCYNQVLEFLNKEINYACNEDDHEIPFRGIRFDGFVIHGPKNELEKRVVQRPTS